MVKSDLFEYIRAQLNAGTSKESIKASLTGAGWADQDVEDTINHVVGNPDALDNVQGSGSAADIGVTNTKVEEQNPSPNNFNAAQQKAVSPGAENKGLRWKSFSDLLSESFEFYKENFKVVIGISIFPMIFMIISFLIFGVYIASLNDAFTLAVNSDLSPLQDLSSSISLIVVFVLIGFFSLVLYMLSHIATVVVIRDNETNVISSYKKSVRHFFPYIWVSILYFLIVLLGNILLIIPGIIFFVWFLFSTTALVFDNKKGTQALSESKRLVSGNFWSVAIKVSVLGMFTTAASWMLSLVAIPFALFSEELGFLLNMLVNAIVTPLGIIFMTLLYKNIRDVKNSDIPLDQIPGYGLSTGEKVVLFGSAFFIALSILIGVVTIATIFRGISNDSFSSVSYVSKARDSQRLADITSIHSKLETHELRNGVFPSSLSSLEGLKEIPVDPVTNKPYNYAPLLNGKDFELCVSYENYIYTCYSADSTLEYPSTSFPEFKFDENIDTENYMFMEGESLDVNVKGVMDQVNSLKDIITL